MPDEKIILTCRNCGVAHQITPPKRKLKKTTEIELTCYKCNYKNNYKYLNKLELVKL